VAACACICDIFSIAGGGTATGEAVVWRRMRNVTVYPRCGAPRRLGCARARRRRAHGGMRRQQQRTSSYYAGATRTSNLAYSARAPPNAGADATTTLQSLGTVRAVTDPGGSGARPGPLRHERRVCMHTLVVARQRKSRTHTDAHNARTRNARTRARAHAHTPHDGIRRVQPARAARSRRERELEGAEKRAALRAAAVAT
jgi:hypothetical protein